MNHLFIMPTYGQPDLVRQALKSFHDVHPSPNGTQICVVDDGSKDSPLLANLCTEFDAQFMGKSTNEGFAKAVNSALALYAKVDFDIITLVNNDIIFTKPVLETIERNFKENPKLGILGAKLLYQDGTIQHAGMQYHSRFRQFLHTNRGTTSDFVNEPAFCIAVTGALFSIGKDCFKNLGLLNPSYFLACEDTEYCLRAWNAGFQVQYDPAYEAIHLEGKTRGVTKVEKDRINKIWTKREIESIRTFQRDLKNFKVDALVRKIMLLNKKPSAFTPKLTKLEVGSGYNPQPEYIHVDVRKGLPNLDYVCDFSKQKLPFKDNTFTDLLANHVIEHISWRKLPFVVKEWCRVLKPGGKILLRTPDLEFICKKYLVGGKTPEHPDDEGYIKKHLSDSITPAWWANIKLFSGQDYDANFHHVCFDLQMMAALLERYGFTRVNRVKFSHEFSPGELQVEAFKK